MAVNEYESNLQEANLDKSVLLVKPAVPELPDTVTYSTAIKVWHSYNKSFHFQTSTSPITDCNKLIENYTLDPHYKKSLKKCLKKVSGETNRCIRYFKNRLFSIDLDELKISQIDWNCFVWLEHGEIDYKNTAVKMLSSPKLTQEQKFAIMCKYCMENELSTFPLHLLSTENFIKKVNFNKDPLLFYWICHLRNEIHKIPAGIFCSIDYVMATKCSAESCEAFQYFWNRSSTADQVSLMISRLESCCNTFSDNSRLLYEMSDKQLQYLLTSVPDCLIPAFLISMNEPRCAIWAWTNSKNFITDEKFAQLVYELLRDENKTRIYCEEGKMIVFMEIWDTASRSQIKHAVEDERLERIVTDNILNGPYKVSSSGVRFVKKFLSLKNTDYRKTAIIKSDLQFILYNDFDAIDEILKLCLPSVKDNDYKEKFKINTKGSIKMPYFCNILYEEQDYSELNRKLLYFLQYFRIGSCPYYVKELIKWIIEEEIKNRQKTETSETPTFDKKAWLKLGCFIKDIFPKRTSIISKIRNSNLSSKVTDKVPIKKPANLSDLCKMIELKYVYEYQACFKGRCITYFQEILEPRQWVTYVTEQENFAAVFSWCFGNSPRLFPEFMYISPIDDIFDEIFKQCRHIAHLYSLLAVLDGFLECYFAGKMDQLIAFKLRKMDNLYVAEVLQRAAGWDWELYEELLKWFNSPNIKSRIRFEFSPLLSRHQVISKKKTAKDKRQQTEAKSSLPAVPVSAEKSPAHVSPAQSVSPSARRQFPCPRFLLRWFSKLRRQTSESTFSAKKKSKKLTRTQDTETKSSSLVSSFSSAPFSSVKSQSLLRKKIKKEY